MKIKKRIFVFFLGFLPLPREGLVIGKLVHAQPPLLIQWPCLPLEAGRDGIYVYGVCNIHTICYQPNAFPFNNSFSGKSSFTS